MAGMAMETGIAPAGNVAPIDEDNTIKTSRKRFVMIPPERCESMTGRQRMDRVIPDHTKYGPQQPA
jgi:hypothetical protein